MFTNLGAAESLIIAIMAAMFTLWIGGVYKLFQKGHTGLGIVAIVGILIPLVALVGYAGWFVEDRTAS